jgi:ABC-type polar amino acid transport system ATPase subunit
MSSLNNVVKRYGDYVALNEVSLMVPRGVVSTDFRSKRSWKTSFIRIINQITLPDSGEIILMVKTATQTRSIHRLFTRRKRIVQQ